MILDTSGDPWLLLSSTLSDEELMQNFKRKALPSDYLFFDSIAHTQSLWIFSCYSRCIYIRNKIIWIFKYSIYTFGFLGSLAGKEYACHAGDPDSIPRSGRSPGEGIGYPLQFLGFPGGSAGKESTCNAGDLGLGRSLEKGTATHSSILAWRIPWSV